MELSLADLAVIFDTLVSSLRVQDKGGMLFRFNENERKRVMNLLYNSMERQSVSVSVKGIETLADKEK